VAQENVLWDQKGRKKALARTAREQEKFLLLSKKTKSLLNCKDLFFYPEKGLTKAFIYDSIDEFKQTR